MGKDSKNFHCRGDVISKQPPDQEQVFIPKQSLAGSNNGLFKGIVKGIVLLLIFQETSLNSKPFVWLNLLLGGVLPKKVFLKFLQNLQDNYCARVSFLMKL